MSPDKANRLASEAAERTKVSEAGAAFAEWLRDNVGGRWPLVDTVRSGYGVHHGRLPRAIASQAVRMFNSGELPVLFCTSTLIEGVNTAAKTVLIFDKLINREKYDFFTFSNIRGRAGRLGRHHVGKVFLFNEPPQAQLTDVSPTLFGHDEQAPDEYVVYLDDPDTSALLDDRVALLRDSLGLDKEGLRAAASIGLEDALALKQKVAINLNVGTKLVWSGVPNYKQLLALTKLICSVRQPREFGATSDKQLTLLIDRLRRASSMRDFLLGYDVKFRGIVTQYDNVFKFLRACEYGLPRLFSVVEMFVSAVRPGTDYSFFLQGLGRWFRPEELKDLDEEGIPMQIAERFYKPGDDRCTLAQRLTATASSQSKLLTDFERKWVSSALNG